MDHLHFPTSQSELDLLEIFLGFIVGISARIKILKPSDVTLLLQLLVLTLRLLRWVSRQHHPLKRSPNFRGVDQDLTEMHDRLLREHNLPPTK